MKASILRTSLTAVAASLACQAFAQVTFFERENFQGRSFTTDQQVGNLVRSGFNDRASSVIVGGERWARWEVCEDIRFGGRCMILRPGHYPSLGAMGLDDRISSVKPIDRDERLSDDRLAPVPLGAQITFYENEGFAGRAFTTEQPVEDFTRFGFNDRASSVVVLGQRWEVCTNSRFHGRCMVLSPGRYSSLDAMGMDDRITSVRVVDWNAQVDAARYAPPPVPVYDGRRHPQERLFEANVTAVHAVVGPPQQRCWMEREEVPATRGDPNVGGAVVGAVLGGILGHQIGGGVGKDIATAGGAVAGAAVGANVGRSAGQPATSRDVQRCAAQPVSTTPAFWDVTYVFRGVEHHVQLTAPPGATVTVNWQGEPRV